MNKRWIGVIASVALALVGAFLLVNYVQGADERALEGEETIEVLVVNEPIARGTAVEELEGKVEIVLVPAKLQTPGSVGDLTALEGTYTSVDLVPGEQLLSSRFVAVDTLVTLDEYPLPEGMLEVTLSLTPERALGGALRPGEEVAVIASFDPFNLKVEEESGAVVVTETEEGTDTEGEEGTVTETAIVGETRIVTTSTPNSTNLIILKALVTNVQVERLPTSSDDEATEGVNLAPTGNLLVSLALDPHDVERTVFTAEFGNVWLARSPDGASDESTPVQTRGTVYLEPGAGLDQASVK
jgi:pilus assembly protein CpaB